MTNQALEEIVKRYDSQEGSVRKFLKEFPLFSEAFENQDLEKTDISFRDELTKRISEFQSQFRKLEESFVSQVDLKNIGKTNPLFNVLDRVSNSIRSSGIGSFGFGSGLKATREEIQKIVEHDFSLLEKLTLLEKDVKDQLVQSPVPDTLISKLIGSLEQFEKDFLARTNLLKK